MDFSVAKRIVFILPEVQGEMLFLPAGCCSPKLCQGTAFPPAEHAILAALIVVNFLISAIIDSINRNVVTQEKDLLEGSASTVYVNPDPQKPYSRTPPEFYPDHVQSGLIL